MKNFILFVLLILSFSTYADLIEKVLVERVVDGDTIYINYNKEILKVRLSEIDAPELNQPYGILSKEFLKKTLIYKFVDIHISGKDRYGRQIARIYYQGQDINKLMVKEGMAWVYTKYNKDKRLPEIQKEAISRKAGLWSQDKPIQPWKWRNK